MSLAASDAEELSGTINDLATSQSGKPSESKPGTGTKLFRVLSRAVDEQGLEWSLLKEPTRSHLDEWLPSPESFTVLP